MLRRPHLRGVYAQPLQVTAVLPHVTLDGQYADAHLPAALLHPVTLRKRRHL